MKFILPINILLLTLLSGWVSGQGTAVVFGKLADEKNKPLELVNVAIIGQPGGTISGRDGSYELEIPANEKVTIGFSFVGYKHDSIQILADPGARIRVDRTLYQVATVLPDFVVVDDRVRSTTLTRVNPKVASSVPSVSGGIESIIQTLPGVVSVNELSSQYMVRGGNFDENLVYVNDIEIYRPILIRSGQQEGLSFVNSDLVSSILFSAGGFDAKYGDKMSSVLDIKYKQPVEFGGSASVSLLGGTVHLEGATDNQRFSYLGGFRYKTNEYLLKGLETTGEYNPKFWDLQGLLRYQMSDTWEVSLLGNFSSNRYEFIPKNRETEFGTIQEARKLMMYFEGQEVDQYKNWLGAVTLENKPSRYLQLKLTGSAYQSFETETYDILGQYWIGLLSNDIGGDQFGNVVEIQGVGSYLEHARNNLEAMVYNIGHRGTFDKNDHYVQWGLNYQHEKIIDEIREWTLIDSAGYSVPNPPDSVGIPSLVPNPFELYDFAKSKNSLATNRITGFIQDSYTLEVDSRKITLTAGIRANYWDYSGQFLLAPKAALSYHPKNWTKDIVFRFAAGWYYQPPFYRELRNFEGELNPDIKAQKSIHLVAASDWDFLAWGRPFKFISELYYKTMSDLIPYEVDNVRTRYYGRNNAKGYATGIDLKINGDFVPGIESWMSLSVMQTKEDLLDDSYVNVKGDTIYPKYIPRPTDQRVNFSMLFQDYLPNNPSYKMNLRLVFGTGLPFGPPKSQRYQQTRRTPPYRRVDIGFSKAIIGEGSNLNNKKAFKNLKAMWVSLEVLNLLDVNNTISYLWVRDVNGYQWAVPNYLTPRQINLKVHIDF